MAKFEQDISEFDDFLQKRRRNSTLIEQDNVSKPKFELEEKTEKAQKCNSRRKYNNAKNKAFLEHLTKPDSYSSKGKQKILDYVSKVILENNKLEKELEEETNCSCNRIGEGLPALEPKKKKTPKNSNKRRFNVVRKKRRNKIFRSLLGADGSVTEEVLIEDTKKPLIDFNSKNTWLGIVVIIGATYFLKNNK